MKKELNIILMEKTNYSMEECNIIDSVFNNHFIIGRNNKKKIIEDLMNKLNITYLEADNIYDITIEIIIYNFFHPFKKKTKI